MNATAVTTKMQHALTFGAHEIKVRKYDGELWISGSDVGRALEYASPDKAVKQIYAAHADEFTQTMTRLFRVATGGGRQMVRFFSLRGAHLVAMFARTEKAKQFRAWVLDVLDGLAIVQRNAEAARTTLEPWQREELEGLCNEVDFFAAWWKKFSPAIELLNPKLYGRMWEPIVFADARAKTLARDLGLKTNHKYFETYPWHASSVEKRAHTERANREGWK